MGVYRPALWLVDVLEDADVTVYEMSGWRDRGRPATVGSFDPRGGMVHHDASPMGRSPSSDDYIAKTGRPPGVPAPLAQMWMPFTTGKLAPWKMLASGRANHAGLGQWGRIPRDCGNTYLLGLEMDLTLDEKVPEEMYESLVFGWAAIARHLGFDVDTSLPGHKEYAPSRKIDPSGVNMARLRRDIKAKLRPPAPAPTPPEPTPAPSPNERRYRVRPGDTLSAIAERYDVTVTRLSGRNKITNPNLIRVGQVLVIPGTTAPPKPKPPMVSLANLRVGRRHDDVREYQQALRHSLGNTRAAQLNPDGATGYYGSQTAAMTKAVYTKLDWLEGDLRVPGPALIAKLGLRRA